MAVLADIIDEWNKLNNPAKVAVGGVGVAAVLFLVSMRGRTGTTNGTQGNALGAAAAASPFTTTLGTPVAGKSPVTTPVKPSGGGKGPTITIPPIHKIIGQAMQPKKPPTPTTGNGLATVANSLSKALHPIEQITHAAHPRGEPYAM